MPRLLVPVLELELELEQEQELGLGQELVLVLVLELELELVQVLALALVLHQSSNYHIPSPRRHRRRHPPLAPRPARSMKSPQTVARRHWRYPLTPEWSYPRQPGCHHHPWTQTSQSPSRSGGFVAQPYWTASHHCRVRCHGRLLVHGQLPTVTRCRSSPRRLRRLLLAPPTVHAPDRVRDESHALW